MMRDYSNVDIFTEEEKNIEHHLPAMVVQLQRRRQPRIRIIPSRRYMNEPNIEGYAGLITHESLHIWLWKNFGLEVAEKLDNLPFPKTVEEAYSGVFGLKRREETLRSE